MSGHDKHKARVAALERLGRPLARRSRATCEIFGVSGVGLRAWEVPPVPADPDLDRTLFLCDACIHGLEAAQVQDLEPWRVLETSMWSEVPAAKVLSVWMLRRLSAQGVQWATPLLDMAYLTPEEQEWLDAL